MSRVTTAQTSFNGGELSRRLRARIDQGLYAISLQEMTGFAPLVEGPAESIPGLIHVAAAPGPCRLLRFEFNKTQGHIIEASDHLWRVYTNDALIESAPGVPLTVASPYSYAQMLSLKVWADFDVLYCYHPDVQTRKFVRTGPTSFAFELHEYANGPFDSRNKNKALTIKASATSGTVQLEASAALFSATDVGRLVQLEVVDFGDTPAWEPGVTVTAGTLRTSLERVYRAATGGTTGSWQPSQTEGLEWDGSKEGTDINGKAAGGVQWEYLHDMSGIVKITAFTDSQHVTGDVVRNLPFSTVAGSGGSGNYDYEGGYWDDGWTVFEPPAGSATYQYGTWRWRLGAFSNTSGWPQVGCIWNERHCVAQFNRVFASVAGDLEDHASFNEFGDISADMALALDCDDPNDITALLPDERLLVLNGSGTFALGPDNPAAAFGPKNRRMRRQNHAPAGDAMAVQSDGRTLFIDKSGGRIYQTEYDPGQINQPAVDLTRYARHIARKGRRFIELAPQRTPHNHLWAVRSDGSLAVANYLPEEEVLGWANRPLATGVLARSIAGCTDPEGAFDQVWVAVTFNGGWHVCRLAEWREDGAFDDTAIMADLAKSIAGAPTVNFAHPLLAGRTVDVVADGRFYLDQQLGPGGEFVADVAASRCVIGLRYPAWIEQLPVEAGGDNGPAIGKMGRIGRAWVLIEHSRGLMAGAPGELIDLGNEAEALPWDSESGFRMIECAGDYSREPRLRVERIAPAQCTLLALGGPPEVSQK